MIDFPIAHENQSCKPITKNKHTLFSPWTSILVDENGGRTTQKAPFFFFFSTKLLD